MLLTFTNSGVVITEAVLNSLWQGMALVTLIWVLVQLAWRANATTRYAIWLAGLVAIILLPLLTILTRAVPPADVVSSVSSQLVETREPSAVTDPSFPSSSAQASNESALTNPSLPTDAVPLADDSTRTAGVPRTGTDNSLAATSQASLQLQILSTRGWTILWCGWLVIAGGLTARLIWSYCYLQKLKRESRPASAENQRRFERLLSAQPSRRPISLNSSTTVLMPIAIGLSRPVIVIPEMLSDYLTEAEFNQVLLHELAHVKRWDDWTNLFQKLAESIFFFFPAILWVGRRLNLEREIACDESVISQTGESRPYAICLAKLAELTVTTRRPGLAPAVIIGRKQVSRRIQLLLKYDRRSLPRFSRAGLIISLAVLLGVLGQFSRMSAVIGVSLPAPTELEQPGSGKVVNAARPAGDSDSDGSMEPATSARTDGAVAERKNPAGLSGSLDDRSTAQAVADSGRAAAATTSSQAVPQANSAGIVVAAGRVPADATAQSATGSRASAPLGNQSPVNVVSAIRLASQIASEGERASALVTIAHSLSGDAPPLAFFEAVSSIKSSAERGRILSVLLERRLSSETLRRLLVATASISSNSEKASLLIKAAAMCPCDESVFGTFLKVIKTIGSSWEQERAMTALLKRDELSSAMLGQVAALAKTDISSSESRQNILELVRRRSEK